MRKLHPLFIKPLIAPLLRNGMDLSGLANKYTDKNNSQWGNLLTLAAAFKDPTLNRHIEEHVLKELFKKTIAFFDLTAQPSSALAIDRRILFALRQELWKSEHNDVDMRAGSSFSSNTSHAAPIPTTPSAPLPPMTEHTPGTPMDLHTQ